MVIQFTASTWPWRVRRTWPLSRSQTRSILSSDALSSGDTEMVSSYTVSSDDAETARRPFGVTAAQACTAAEFLGGSVSCCRLLQFGPHFVAFPRHVQFAEYIKGGRQLFPLSCAIALFAHEKAPIPVAVSQTAPVAQLQAERFLFLVQRHGLLQPAPDLQDRGLAAVAALQTILVAKLQAERFLFLVQCHGFLQAAPVFQDHGLVAVAGLQTVLVAQLQAERFLSLEQLKSLLQPAPSFQDHGLVAVAYLQTVLVTQLQAERFLFLKQRHGSLQPAPGLQDQGLVAVAGLQT